jgi:hypothetical protein
MAGILKRALENPGMKDKELAQPFGYGAPFAAKYRSWLNKTGIIELGFPAKLTPKGNVLYESDPDLESLTTQWFMHWELTEDPTRAEAWHYFAKEFLPKHSAFTYEDLLDGLTMKLRHHSEKHFGPGSRLNQVIARKLIDCYTKVEALGAMQLLEKNGNLFISGKKIDPLGPWNTSDELTRAYNS